MGREGAMKFLAAGLIIWFGLFSLLLFGCLWAWGEYKVYEPSKALLGIETAVAFGVLAFGFWYLYRR